jgi:hypothetical protein
VRTHLGTQPGPQLTHARLVDQAGVNGLLLRVAVRHDAMEPATPSSNACWSPHAVGNRRKRLDRGRRKHRGSPCLVGSDS